MERADSRCLTPARTERIGGQLVAQWKGQPEPEKVSLNATRTILYTIGSLVVVMLLSRWIIERTKAGDFTPGWIFAIVVMASPLILLVIVLIQKARRGHKVEPIVPSCADLPRAVPVRVSLTNTQAFRGRSNGWIFVADGLLTFRGEYFDFALRPDDFTRPKKLMAQLTDRGAPVTTPKGISPQMVHIRFLAREDERWIVDDTGKKRFERDFDAWLNSRTSLSSVFPPLRDSKTAVRVQGMFAAFGGVGLLLGLVVWQLPWILGTDTLADRNMLTVGILTFLFMLCLPASIAMSAKGSRPFDREVEKVLEGERKGMTTPSK